MNFRVGQKVVCITDEWVTPVLFVCPKKGQVYTVREKRISPWSRVPVGLRFVEIVNPVWQFANGVAEPAWNAQAFRPLVERKTDISIFHQILDDVNRRAPERRPERAVR